MKKILSFLFCFCLIAFVSYAGEKSDHRIVVFDFGGVIADFHRTPILRFFRETFGLNEKELSFALKERQSLGSGGSSKKKFWSEFAARRKIALPPDWYDRYEAAMRESIGEIPGTLSVVKELLRQGYHPAMLSNVTSGRAEIIREAGYYEFFYPVLLSYEIGAEKPDSKAYKILLERLEVPGESVIFIDDKAENVKAARKSGIDAIRFVNAEQLKKALKVRRVDLSGIDDYPEDRLTD